MNASNACIDLTKELARIESAKEFLGFIGAEYDPQVLRVYRLRILQRFHDYLSVAGLTSPDHDSWKILLTRTYNDFVRSNARTEAVFRVFQHARGIATVPLSAIGTVIDIGSFLMDQVIYSIHFLDAVRIVGCREEELIGLDETWIETRFESRDRVLSARPLAIEGEVRVPAGSRGEIEREQRVEAVLEMVSAKVVPVSKLEAELFYRLHFERVRR